MSVPSDRRSRKRLATRQGISNAATRLFFERGFDQVTVDEIAAAADVGRMTVFNYFPRKEDMFFDRDEESREMPRAALRQRAPDVSPLEALHGLVHRLVQEGSPYIEFSDRSQGFVRTIKGSETLKARARAIRDEFTHAVAPARAGRGGRDPAAPAAHLAAALLVATWTVAFVQALADFGRKGDAEQARAAFLAIVDKGAVGLQAALAVTPYVESTMRAA